MRSFRSLGSGSSPSALPALLRATHLFGLALGSASGRLRESGATAARLFERAEESALLLHVWMVELTDVKGLFGLLTFKVAVVFDAFSRMPLSARVFSKEASALEIARFVSRTAKRHGRPEGTGRGRF